MRRLLSTSFLRNVAVIAGGGAIAQAIPIVFTPLLTRIYSPADFGIFGLFTAFIRFATNALTLEYSKAIVSARDEDEALGLAILSAVLVIPVSLMSVLVVFTLTRNEWLGFGALSGTAIALIGVALILAGAYSVLRYWLLRLGHFRVITKATIGQSVGRIGSQVVLGFAMPGWWGLAGGAVLGPLLGLRQMWHSAGGRFRRAFQSINMREVRNMGMRYRKFPLVALPSTMLNTLSLSIPLPLITASYGIEAAGQFSMTTRIMLVPLALVGGSVGDVFLNRISAISREAPTKASVFTLKVVGGLALVGVLPMAVVWGFGEDLFSVVLGEEWRLAGAIAVAITPWFFAQLVVSPISRLAQVYQAQEQKLVYDILALCSVVGVISLGTRSGWSLVQTCTALGLSQAVVYLVYLLLLFRVLSRKKLINVSNPG